MAKHEKDVVLKKLLVIQSYGAEHEFRRAIFSIWSFYAFSSVEATTILFTDNPEFFKHYLKGLPVVFITMTDEKIKQMRGEIDFVHRVKIAAIEEAYQYNPEVLFYIDSDTFFIDDPRRLFETISPSRTFMHAYEYRFREMRDLKLPAGERFHYFLNFVLGRDFLLSDGTSLKISADQLSWNAGVIVLGNAHHTLLPDVFRLTDEFYANTQHHGAEQYAFDIMLGRSGEVLTCESEIYHYWVVVKKKIVDEFLSSRLTETWARQSGAQKSEDIRGWTTTLPKFIERHFLWLRHNSIQAFHENNFTTGYSYAFRAWLRKPFNFLFLRDVAYHVARNFSLKRP